jgi:hypothetical protein
VSPVRVGDSQPLAADLRPRAIHYALRLSVLCGLLGLGCGSGGALARRGCGLLAARFLGAEAGEGNDGAAGVALAMLQRCAVAALPL